MLQVVDMLGFMLVLVYYMLIAMWSCNVKLTDGNKSNVAVVFLLDPRSLLLLLF